MHASGVDRAVTSIARVMPEIHVRFLITASTRSFGSIFKPRDPHGESVYEEALATVHLTEETQNYKTKIGEIFARYPDEAPALWSWSRHCVKKRIKSNTGMAAMALYVLIHRANGRTVDERTIADWLSSLGISGDLSLAKEALRDLRKRIRGDFS